MWRTVNRRRLAPVALDSLRNVRPDFHKTVAYGLIALAALIVGSQFDDHTDQLRMRLIAWACAVVVAIFGAAASRTCAREVQRIVVARAGAVAATPLRLLVLLTGYLIAVFAVCDLIDLTLRHVLLGGAVTGVILGLAAQPVLGNLFAGLVLLFARPYVPGQRIRVVSGPLNGQHVGVIVSAGLLYTVLETGDGPLNIPNSALMAAAVGPSLKHDDHDAHQAGHRDTESGIGPRSGPPTAEASALAAIVAGAEAGSHSPGRYHQG